MMKKEGLGRLERVMEVIVDFSTIEDWDGFHSAFAKIMGFPSFYGRNMDAWIDCMTYIDDPDAGMSSITVMPGESLDIQVLGGGEALKRCPAIFQAFVECAAFVNQRFMESGSGTRLKMVAA